MRKWTNLETLRNSTRKIKENCANVHDRPVYRPAKITLMYSIAYSKRQGKNINGKNQQWNLRHIKTRKSATKIHANQSRKKTNPRRNERKSTNSTCEKQLRKSRKSTNKIENVNEIVHVQMEIVNVSKSTNSRKKLAQMEDTCET